MRLVVAQGETIQTQLRRMQERDQQIENFEHQLHLLRVKNLGSDYLLQSYLKEPQSENSPQGQSFSKEELLCEEKSNDSGVITEEAQDLPDINTRLTPPGKAQPTKQKDCLDDLEDVRARTLLLDKLEGVLLRLLEHEEALSRLEDTLTESAAFEIAELEAEIAEAARAHALTVANARQNEQKLRELDTMLLQRRMTLEALLEEDTRHEEETIALQAHLDYIIHLPPTAFKLPPDEKPAPPSSTINSKTAAATLHKSGPSLPPKAPQLPNSKIQPPRDKHALTAAKKESGLLSKAPPTKSHSERQVPPPVPSTSPPPLDEDDDKDSGKTNSLCVSSRSSTSSDSSSGGGSPCEDGLGRETKPRAKPSAESSKDVDSTDSNSDTGLSSLHSSSDEGAYVLDTLV